MMFSKLLYSYRSLQEFWINIHKSRWPKRNILLSILLLSTSTIATVHISAAIALESIRLSYIVGRDVVSLQDLDQFANTGEPPRNLRTLINRLTFFTGIDAAQVHEGLTTESIVNHQYLVDVSETDVVERYFKLASKAIALPNGEDPAWIYLRDALLDASDDNLISPIEYLQALNVQTLDIKTYKWEGISKDIAKDEDVMEFLRITFPEMEAD